MSETWCVYRDGNACGFFTKQQLMAMARDGRLRPTDVLRKDSISQGVRAGSVPGLFPIVASPTAVDRGHAHGRARPPSSVSEDDGSLLATIPPPARLALVACASACLIFVVSLIWWVKRSERTRAVTTCNAACMHAEDWLHRQGGLDNAQDVLGDLVKAVNQKSLPEAVAAHAKAILTRVRKRKAELESDRIYAAAEKAIQGQRVGDAAVLLAKYTEMECARRVPEAQGLLKEIYEASTKENIVAALVQLPDADFERVKAGGEILDGKVTRQELVSTRQSLVPELIAFASKHREHKQRLIAAERKSHIAAIAQRAAVDTVKALGEGLKGLRSQAPPGALDSPLFAFGTEVQSQLVRELKKRLIDAAGSSDPTDGVEQKLLAESQRWLREVQLRLQAEIKDATRSPASRITPTPVPRGPFRQRFEVLSQKRDVNSLRSWGHLKVLIASHGLSLDDIDWCEWHFANKTPTQDFSPEEREKYLRYLRLAAAGY